jgi:C-terminal processing protease CtpA/Prc
MKTSAARLFSTVLAVFVITPVYAQSSNPLARPSEGMVGRQSPGFLTLQGPGSQIGVSARDLTAAETPQSSGDWFTSQAGVVIDQVSSWSPASRAGLMKGDVVTIFDGYPVRNVAHFNRLVGETPPGRTVRMTIVRGEKTQQLSITPIL